MTHLSRKTFEQIQKDLADVMQRCHAAGVDLTILYQANASTGVQDKGLMTGACPHCAARQLYSAADECAAIQKGCGVVEWKPSRRDLKHERE
jgi:hypothetical protein